MEFLVDLYDATLLNVEGKMDCDMLSQNKVRFTFTFIEPYPSSVLVEMQEVEEGPIHPLTQDGFIAKVNANSSFAWGSFLGGSGDDGGACIALDRSDNVWTTGYTTSTDFPTPGGFDTNYNGGTPFGDAFIAKILNLPSAPLAPTLDPIYDGGVLGDG